MAFVCLVCGSHRAGAVNTHIHTLSWSIFVYSIDTYYTYTHSNKYVYIKES